MTASVLVADDDPNILLSLEFLLKQAGYAVRVAADGEAVLSAVREAVPDLLLLDVMMPKRNGYDVCQTIRADHGLDGLRILMLTAKGRDIERDKGMALGADDYITKPFSTRDMLARVREMLARPRQ
ncbi:MAG: response regulator [Alphaproteobacteria bacterium]|jgi:DNA-binding response OmpR family regulator|nr:response regulator [Alphaproteobacteria bacterium]